MITVFCTAAEFRSCCLKEYGMEINWGRQCSQDKSKAPWSNLMVWFDGTLNVNCDLAFFAKLALIVGHTCWLNVNCDLTFFAKLALIVGHTCWHNYKQLLDEAFGISRIMEVEVGVISGRQRLRLITLTKISIILDITKSKSNKKTSFYYTLNRKK